VYSANSPARRRSPLMFPPVNKTSTCTLGESGEIVDREHKIAGSKAKGTSDSFCTIQAALTPVI